MLPAPLRAPGCCLNCAAGRVWGFINSLRYTLQEMSSVTVIGAGYVGLTTAVCLADLGHRVTGVDIDEAKVTRLRTGEPTIYEPGLKELMASALRSGRISRLRLTIFHWSSPPPLPGV